jgi:hypothetical protein
MESLTKNNKTEILEIKSALNQTKNIVESHLADWNKWKTEFQGSNTKQI